MRNIFIITGKTIIRQFRSSLKDNHDDIHARLMSHYKEAPEWWYVNNCRMMLSIFIISLAKGTPFCFLSLLFWQLSYAITENWCHGIFYSVNDWQKNTLTEKKSFRLVAIAIAFFFLLPTGIVQAVTNQSIGTSATTMNEFHCRYSFNYKLGLNVITEFVAGVAIPGDPLGNVTFKTYGYITQFQALLLISDLKLGHYMKVKQNLR